MRLFLSYLRQRRKGLIVFCLFCGVFAVSFILYRLPAGAVVYPVLLCILLGIIFLLWDFSRAKEKHKALTEIRKLTAAMIDTLPEAEGMDEEDYQEIIRALQREAEEKSAAASMKYQEMIEYYTVWVHQIKTPITSMRLSLENEDTPFSKKLNSDLFQIEQYVDMVLAFLRMDSESNDYVFKEVPLDDILTGSITKFSSEFINRKIKLNYTPSGERIVTDEKWLSFVIDQILSNALKYTKEGEIGIILKEGKILCIEDTGIGIDPADLPRVFEKGYTGLNGRSDKRASGIGLYLCRRICRNLGVKISITSKPGEGTCVSLDLAQYELKNE